MHKKNLSIVKIGGNIIENQHELDTFLKLFSNIKGPKILVHGGGKKATYIADKLGIKTEMKNGRRITNADSLEVITMVYAGLLNKTIVAKLQALNTNALGLSGADCNAITSKKRAISNIDFGFVGDIEDVNSGAITKFLETNITPVFCAITHDNKGQLLNTNADTIASSLAVGLSNAFNTSIYYCFELNGVLKDFSDKTSVIKHINKPLYTELLNQKRIADGMLPKMANCFKALENGVQKVYIGNTNILTKTNTNYTTITL